MTVKLWTNGTDFVMAESAEQAIAEVTGPNGGLDAESAGEPREWSTEPESIVWTIHDDETGGVENISICALLARHVAEGGPIPFYQWSYERCPRAPGTTETEP